MAKLPPQPWFDAKTGEAKPGFYAWAQALQSEQNTTNINSGARIREAEAAAAAAQAAADAAASQAASVGAESGALSLSTLPASRLKTQFGAGSITSSSFTAVPANGTGPFTYLWTVISGDAVTINTPTAVSTTVTSTIAIGQEKVTQLQCVVTDSLAATATGNAANTFAEIS